ncbi:MAG: hypothetical protein ACUVQK_15765, partial [Thermogutta sp.]
SAGRGIATKYVGAALVAAPTYATTSLRWRLPQSVLHHARARSLGRPRGVGTSRYGWFCSTQ